MGGIIQMAATIRASIKGLEYLDQIRRKKGWTKAEQAWADLAITTTATLKRFWGRQPIRQESFIKICEAVDIDDWQSLIDTNSISLSNSYIDFTVYDDAWVGRETLVKNLNQEITNSCRVLLLVGLTGIGKTALAEKIIGQVRGSWIEERENFDNQEKSSDFVSVASQWLQRWGEFVPPDQIQPHQLRQRLLKRLCENKYLILMDSLEYLLVGNEDNGWSDFVDPEWEIFFISLLSEPHCSSCLILTSQDSPILFSTAEFDRYKNLWYSQSLGGLEIDEQLQLFQKLELEIELELSTSPLRMIGEVYNGHPLILRIIAGEIKNTYSGNVQAYWKINSSYIEEVKTALEEARSKGIIHGESDRWRLDSYSRELRLKVKDRVESIFERLNQDAHDAYLLLCTASVYRCEVPEDWWLSHLEYRGYDQQKQNVAMQALRSRYLVEDGGFDIDNNLLVKQHNLIRSVAINHRLKLAAKS
jgi:hypothetical protein